jgi:hypothetical protein
MAKVTLAPWTGLPSDVTLTRSVIGKEVTVLPSEGLGGLTIDTDNCEDDGE